MFKSNSKKLKNINVKAGSNQLDYIFSTMQDILEEDYQSTALKLSMISGLKSISSIRKEIDKEVDEKKESAKEKSETTIQVQNKTVNILCCEMKLEQLPDDMKQEHLEFLVNLGIFKY